MRNIIKHLKGESSFVTWIKKRIKNNLNFLAIAEGPTGIGKSWALLSIAYELDKDFESRQVAFSFKQLMDILNSDWFDKKKVKIIIFDEAQTDISNRSWQSLTNRLMNYLLSTFRHRNIILLFTSPYSDFLDIQTMKLMHCKLEVRGHNKRKKKTIIRPKLLQYNSKFKKFYEHSLFVIKDSRMKKMVFWTIQKPPEHLVNPYEKDKVGFTDKLNRDILEALEAKDKGKKEQELTKTSMQPDIWNLAKTINWETQEDLRQELSKQYGRKVDKGQFNRNINWMRNKGKDVTQFKKSNKQLKLVDSNCVSDPPHRQF